MSEITLAEISDITNGLNVMATKLVIMNQQIVIQSKEFEKIYFEYLLPLRKSLEILTDRKRKEVIGENENE